MILFLRFRRATLLLTRGMDRSLHHQQTLETVLVALRHQRGLAQATLPLGMLLSQDVPLVRVVATQPAAPRQADAFAQCTLRFLLGHRILIVVVRLRCPSAVPPEDRRRMQFTTAVQIPSVSAERRGWC